MDNQRATLAALTSPQHTAVLVVDVQPLFTAMPLVPALDGVLPRLQRFLAAARASGVPRVFIRMVVQEDRWTAVWQDQFAGSVRPDDGSAVNLKDALAPGSPVMPFAPGFAPEPDDLVVIKHRYSAFVGTDLATELRSRGIRTVVLVGLTTDVCVGSTARDAFHHEFHTVTLSDCTAEQTLARYESGLATLAANFGRVCTSEELLAVWQAQPALAAAQV